MFRKCLMGAAVAALVFTLATPADAAKKPKDTYAGRLVGWGDQDATGRVEITHLEGNTYRGKVEVENLAVGTYKLIWTNTDPTVEYVTCTFNVKPKKLKQSHTCKDTITVPTSGAPWISAVRRVDAAPNAESEAIAGLVKV